MRNIEKRKDEIIEKLDVLFGDTTVPQETTLSALEEIQSDVEGKIDALEADIKHKL